MEDTVSTRLELARKQNALLKSALSSSQPLNIYAAQNNIEQQMRAYEVIAARAKHSAEQEQKPLRAIREKQLAYISRAVADFARDLWRSVDIDLSHIDADKIYSEYCERLDKPKK